MNVDRVLAAFNQHQVEYLLIGGMNYLLRHEPVLTYDIDLWIRDDEGNRGRCESALVALEAEWGPTEAGWGAVAKQSPGWLLQQPLFCMTSPFGSIDVFREVCGLGRWEESRRTAEPIRTAGGVECHGISDEDMIRCQLALEESDRNMERVKKLQATLEQKGRCP